MNQLTKMTASITGAVDLDSTKAGTGVQSGNAAFNSIAANAKTASKVSKFGRSAMKMAGKVAPVLSVVLDVFFPDPDKSLAAIANLGKQL